jgi:hypothetical protein
LPNRYAVHVGKMWLETVAVAVRVGVCDDVAERVLLGVIVAVEEGVVVLEPVVDGLAVCVTVELGLTPKDNDADGVPVDVCVLVAVEEDVRVCELVAVADGETHRLPGLYGLREQST